MQKRDANAKETCKCKRDMQMQKRNKNAKREMQNTKER